MRLLYKLILSEEPLKVTELAKELGVSMRTIQYDLHKIDDFLDENGLPLLIRKTTHTSH